MLQSQLNFEAMAVASSLEALGDELLLQAFVLLHHLGGSRRGRTNEMQPRMSATIPRMATPEHSLR